MSTGRVCTPETRAKIAAKSRGRVASPETRAKMSEAHIRRARDPELRARLRAMGKRFGSGADHPLWQGDDASYGAVHQRVNKGRTGACTVCPAGTTRTEMALIHGRGTRADETGADAGRAYSTRLEDYREMCVRCHRVYDHFTVENYDRAVAFVRSVDALRSQGLVSP